MKKSLTFKFIVIITSIMIVSLVLFLIIISNVFKMKYKEVNNARLIQFVTSTSSSWSKGDMNDTGYEYIYGSNKSSSYETSTNILSYCDTSTINQIVRDYKSSSYTISPLIKEYKHKGEILYACGYSIDGNYLVAVTDSGYVNSQTRNMVFITAIIFICVTIFMDLVFYYFSKKIINKIYRIKDEITSLKDNNYLKPINDYGNDEIGLLANGIEDLRNNILDEEKKRKEMFQNLSHDLKTPISVIKSYSEGIKDGVCDLESVDIILKEIEVLEMKTSKLLELNKIEYIKNNNFQDVYLKDLILDTISKYKTNIKIDLELEDISFKGFKDNYKTIIENMMENALRYAKTRISIVLKEESLCFYNDGPNINEDIINEIFLPFVKGEGGISGVGLSIVKRTLEVFGYKIEANNKDIGVEFKIYKA